MSLPSTGAFGTGLEADLDAAEAAALHEQVVAACKQHAGAMAASELTIASGSVTPSRWCHTVDTEGNAASDDLVKILTSGLEDGALLLLVPENTARVVTVKTQAVGVGRILLDGAVDFVMDADYKRLLLRREGNQWKEVMRVEYAPTGVPHGRQVFTASGTFTAQVTGWHDVTEIGAGGGGGAGAGNNGDDPNTGGNGGDGESGSASSFGSYVSAGGGTGGGGGNKNGAGGGGSPGLNQPGGRAVILDSGAPKGFGGYPVSTPLSTYGRGGRGGDSGSGGPRAGGGGASGHSGTYVFRYPVYLIKGQTVAVTVGTGGAGGTAGTGTTPGIAGEAGADGCVIVEW